MAKITVIITVKITIRINVKNKVKMTVKKIKITNKITVKITVKNIWGQTRRHADTQTHRQTLQYYELTRPNGRADGKVNLHMLKKPFFV